MSSIVKFLDHRAEAEIIALGQGIQKDFYRIVQLISQKGIHKISEPYVKFLGNKLWEIRAQGKEGKGRAIYMLDKSGNVVVLHAFNKKTSKTPRRALETATKRAKKGGLL